MLRKLYALFILIWAIWALVLAYLYFFVYYTATLVVNTNVTEYTVELFSKSTATKFSKDCQDEICIITDVSPFEYNITVSKSGYNPQVVPVKITSRRREELYINLEKKVILEPVILIDYPETMQEKVVRIREENRYYASFNLQNSGKMVFEELGDSLKMILQTPEQEITISEFPKVPKSEVLVDDISGSDDLYIKLWKDTFIYSSSQKSVHKLPYQIVIQYIKKWRVIEEYIVVTEKGAFIYNSWESTSEFQYLFRDYVYAGDDIIGIIYKDEIKKKENFDLSEWGNLILRYNPQTKNRKVIYNTQEAIDSIKWQGESVILTAWENTFELKNF